MKVTIQTPGFKARRKLLKTATERIKKLGETNARVLEGIVLMKEEKSDTQQNKICEAKLIVPGNDLFAARRSSTFEDALIKVANALKQQLADWKEKKIQKRKISTKQD